MIKTVEEAREYLRKEGEALVEHYKNTDQMLRCAVRDYEILLGKYYALCEVFGAKEMSMNIAKYHCQIYDIFCEGKPWANKKRKD